MDLEDALDDILWKHGSHLSLEDLCDNDDECEMEGEGVESQNGAKEEGAESNDLGLDLDELLRKRII